MNKKILILTFSDDITQEGMIDIKCHASHYGMTADEYNIKTEEELNDVLNKGNKYDYIYLAGHGNDKCVGDANGLVISWLQMGNLLCISGALNQNAILMLYCCRGGLNQVAYQLFASCPNIQYICGARQSMKNIDLIIGFNVFVYNIENRNIDPILAAEKATLATENRFICFDRLEVETEPMYYYNYCIECNKPANNGQV